MSNQLRSSFCSRHKRGGGLLLLIVASAVTACADAAGPLATDQQQTEAERIAARIEQERAKHGDHWPYGVPLPPGDTAWLPPEPYDPDKHGPLERDLQPFTPGQKRPGLPPLPKKPGVSMSMAAATDTGHTWGLWVLDGGTGSYGTMSINRSVNIPYAFNTPEPVVVFAPTFLGANLTCIEQSIRYARNAFTSLTRRDLTFYNHCQMSNVPVGYILQRPLDTMELTYIRWDPVLWSEALEVSVFYTYRNNNPNEAIYIGMAYAWGLGRWIALTPEVEVGPTEPGMGGWMGWEAYGIDDVAPLCLDFPNSQMKDASTYLVPKVYWPITSEQFSFWYQDGYCWDTGKYWTQLYTPYSWWKADTSQPW